MRKRRKERGLAREIKKERETVNVQRQPVPPRERPHGLHISLRHHPPAAAVVRLPFFLDLFWWLGLNDGTAPT